MGVALRAGLVDQDRREVWGVRYIEEGVDVLISHPRLVQTGLDLIDLPTILRGEVHYSVYTIRQASCRSWCIGQKHPVQVVFMAYRISLKADALELVAKKFQSSPAAESEFPENGLAAYGDDDDDLMIALARQIVSREEDEESVEAVFAQARTQESISEEFMVDDGWQAVKAEPELVEVHWSGAGVAVEEAANSHAAQPEETPETQRSLFSWAEFIAEEPAKPPGRSRKPKPSFQSLFEWALSMEQERDEELVGERR